MYLLMITKQKDDDHDDDPRGKKQNTKPPIFSWCWSVVSSSELSPSPTV